MYLAEDDGGKVHLRKQTRAFPRWQKMRARPTSCAAGSLAPGHNKTNALRRKACVAVGSGMIKQDTIAGPSLRARHILTWCADGSL